MPNFNIILSGFGLNGLKAIRYNGSGSELTTGVSGYNKPLAPAKIQLNNGVLGNERNSYLGTPVVSDLTLESYEYPILKPDTVRFETVLIEVSQRKNIVTTGIVGKPGTIKEYISDSDFDVKIRGAIVSPDGTYPDEQVRNFIKILLKPKEVKVISDFLRLFNIYQIVITDYTFGQKEGYQNLQFFEITALSDTPEDLLEDDYTIKQ